MTEYRIVETTGGICGAIGGRFFDAREAKRALDALQDRHGERGHVFELQSRQVSDWIVI